MKLHELSPAAGSNKEAYRNGRGNGSGNGIVQGNFEHVARRVGALCDHPALFCWYLFDEPEVPGQYVAPKLLTEFAELQEQELFSQLRDVKAVLEPVLVVLIATMIFAVMAVMLSPLFDLMTRMPEYK